MRIRIIIAAVLLLLGALIHTIGGELTNIKELLNTPLQANLLIELRGVWYLLAIDFLFSGAYLFYVLIKNTINENLLVINFIGIRMLLYGAVFLCLILFSQAALLWEVPQWLLLGGIGFLLQWDQIKKFFSQKHKP